LSLGNDSSERLVISSLLEKVARQFRLNCILDHFSVAVCFVFATLLTVKILGMLVNIWAPPPLIVVATSAAFLIIFLIGTQYGARHLGQAAAVADDAGRLNDELKSAYWFMRQPHTTIWTEAQVHRASQTARGLQAKRLVPTIVPQRLWIAAMLGGILVSLQFVPAGPPLLAFTNVSVDPSSLTQAQEEQFEEIRNLVEQAQILDETTAEEDQISADAQERLEEAMRALEADQLTMEELLRELREAQNSLEEGNLEMSAMQEALEDLAQDLEGSSDLSELAEAMKNQDLAEAAEMMRNLAEQLSQMDGQQLAEMAEQLQQAAQGDQASMEELMQALQEAAEAMSDEQMAEAMQAMQEAAEAMEGMSQRMDSQEMMNQAAQQMQAMQQSMSQQQLAQQMMSQQAMASDQAGESQEGAMAMPSDEVQKTAASGDMGNPSQEGGPAGHATSDAIEDAEMQLGAPTTLEVQLEMEVLAEEEESPEEAPDPEDIFQESSRQETARVEYRNVRSLQSYAEGSVLSVEQIPWRYRNLVKRYFLAIRPRENQ
jgi:hypothetical protein|tara:strand:- start:2053 stop:3684 length:1632 start_codon:yes stop_codon:yes gene_type:complete